MADSMLSEPTHSTWPIQFDTDVESREWPTAHLLQGLAVMPSFGASASDTDIDDGYITTPSVIIGDGFSRDIADAMDRYVEVATVRCKLLGDRSAYLAVANDTVVSVQTQPDTEKRSNRLAVFAAFELAVGDAWNPILLKYKEALQTILKLGENWNGNGALSVWATDAGKSLLAVSRLKNFLDECPVVYPSSDGGVVTEFRSGDNVVTMIIERNEVTVMSIIDGEFSPLACDETRLGLLADRMSDLLGKMTGRGSDEFEAAKRC